jgi:hypothetical protein
VYEEGHCGPVGRSPAEFRANGLLAETVQRVSRTAHFLVGFGILALCAVWCFVCFVGFIGTAISRDSVPGASLYDSSYVMIYLVGGAGLICGLWLAFSQFSACVTLTAIQRAGSSSGARSRSGAQPCDRRREAGTFSEKAREMKTLSNQRPGADAGWRVLFAFVAQWPAAPQQDHSA